MVAYSALEQALELFDRPELAEVVRIQPLPAGVLNVIRIAADDADAIADAVKHTGRTAEVVRDAAVTYVHQALFAAGGDAARTIGTRPDDPFETKRKHAHTLLKWLHPDATQDEWDSVFAERVASAWDTLKRERGKTTRRSGKTERPTGTTSNGRPKLFRTTPRPRRRSNPRSRPLRRRIAAPRLGLLTAVLAGVCVIGYQIIATAMANSLARTDPEAALTWQGSHPTANAEAARLLLLSEDPTNLDVAAVHLVAAIDASPVVSGGATSLALANEARGDADRSRALMREAGRLSRRDMIAQLRLFVRDGEDGAFGSALDRLDALLRTRPSLFPSLQSALLELAMASDIRPALLSKLGEAPPWRPRLLSALMQVENGDLVAREIMVGLHDAGADLEPGEQALVINAMVGAGHVQIAFLTWSALLPNDKRASIPYVFNGDFEGEPTGVLFDWKVSQVAGADTEVVDAAGQGRAMQIVFGGRRVPYRHLEKVLLLAPGTYRLTGLVRAENLETERGLSWRVTCLDGDSGQLGETPAAKGTFPWQDMTLTFTVPPLCTAQRLRLELVTRARLDQLVAGTMWYDSLRIVRLPARTAGDASLESSSQ